MKYVYTYGVFHTKRSCVYRMVHMYKLIHSKKLMVFGIILCFQCMQFNVKAIVDWKYGKNGDPMSDVAYFLMMFLNPSDYGISGLNCYPLTIGEVITL